MLNFKISSATCFITVHGQETRKTRRMGAKHSKKKEIEVIWSLNEDSFEIEDEGLEDLFLFAFVSSSLLKAIDLERSVAVDRQRNSLGLPDDVLGLIASLCDAEDLGRIALVCKTWRRIALRDSVWIVHLQRRGLKWDGKNGSARKMFLEAVLPQGFVFIPPDVRASLDCVSSVSVPIVVAA